MAWVRIDDKYPGHSKIMPLSDGAFRAHVTLLCFSAQHATDGALTSEQILSAFSLFRVRKRMANTYIDELVNNGLAHRNGALLVLHDFLDYNPSSHELKMKKRLNRDRQKRFYKAHRSPEFEQHNGNPNALGSALPNAVTNAAPLPIRKEINSPNPSDKENPPPFSRETPDPIKRFAEMHIRYLGDPEKQASLKALMDTAGVHWPPDWDNDLMSPEEPHED